MSNNSGVWGRSSENGYKRFLIATPDDQTGRGLYEAKRFLELMGVPHKPTFGSYTNDAGDVMFENGFIIPNPAVGEPYYADIAEWLESYCFHQESILIIGEVDRYGYRRGTLLYPDGTEKLLGTLIEVTEGYAKKQGNWTRIDGAYWVC